GNEFNEKLFRQQLAYFNDVDFSEQIIWLPNFEKTEEEIKQKLTEIGDQTFLCRFNKKMNKLGKI
ncbi:MAG: hypothetical protein KGH81_05555, partial [Thaumarchaeota archaeon]|nr:hypothetical protein [Nitrososphaerota archaeon]